jgi:hypothetical protein
VTSTPPASDVPEINCDSQSRPRGLGFDMTL